MKKLGYRQKKKSKIYLSKMINKEINFRVDPEEI